jgi:hypothetical protein
MAQPEADPEPKVPPPPPPALSRKRERSPHLRTREILKRGRSVAPERGVQNDARFKPTLEGFQDVAARMQATVFTRDVPQGTCSPTIIRPADPDEEGELSDGIGDGRSEVDPDEDHVPEPSNVQKGILVKEAEFLQGSVIRCQQCNTAISKETILCPQCFHPSQGDLSPDDAAFVREVASIVPAAVYQAVEKAKAAAAAAAGPGSDSDNPDGPAAPKTAATHVAGVRLHVGKATNKVRSTHANLARLWFKYYNRARDVYHQTNRGYHLDPNYD